MHPFSIPASFQFWVAGVCWSLAQLSRGERRHTPWISRHPIAGLTLKDRQTFTLTHTYGQFSLINSPDNHVFGSWEETEVPGEATHAQGEHANSTQKGQSRDWNPKPSCGEATALINAPPCHLYIY